jgi:hypothetical protein
MTEIYIEDIRSSRDLRDALAALDGLFAEVRSPECLVEVLCYRDQGAAFTCEVIAEAPAAGSPTVPCTQRGTHEQLTECWLCWSDVMRGAALETDVLADGAWTAIVSRLQQSGQMMFTEDSEDR